MIRSIQAGVHTASLVKVLSCTNDGGLSPFGFVDLQPLVNQVDGFGNPVPQPVIHGCPYFSLQGGADAIIMDPKVGDQGIAVFAERDITRVVANANAGQPGAANPGSGRKFDLSDGLYIGGLLNGIPTQYIQFNSSGISIVTPNDVVVTAGGNATVTAEGDISATATTGDITVTATAGDITANAGGDITATAATTASVTAPTITLNGPTVVNGSLNVTGIAHMSGVLNVAGAANLNGGSAVAGALTNNGQDVGSAHAHPVSGVQSGGSTVESGPPNT